MGERSYTRVRWRHGWADQPIDLWSELDEQRFETRKIEYYRDGTAGWAYGEIEAGGTALGLEPVPSIEEIAADPDFSSEIVTKSDFEMRWAALVRDDA